MRTVLLTIVSSLGLLGCAVEPFGPDAGSIGEIGQNCNPKQDMGIDMVQTTLCPAATGLSGTLIDCFDFSKETIATLTGKGWSFDSGPGCAWDVKSGVLTNTSVGMLNGDCAIRLTTKNIPVNKSSITLSVVQQSGLGNNLLASLYLFSTTKPPLLQTNNINNSQLTVAFASTDDRVMNNQYKLIIHEINGIGIVSGPGWQISSIAVMGNP